MKWYVTVGVILIILGAELFLFAAPWTWNKTNIAERLVSLLLICAGILLAAPDSPKVPEPPLSNVGGFYKIRVRFGFSYDYSPQIVQAPDARTARSLAVRQAQSAAIIDARRELDKSLDEAFKDFYTQIDRINKNIHSDPAEEFKVTTSATA